ncbi:hypothetical protein HBI81_131520 [Parastagonospora nodorum]|nr:hypothetical protein HBH51_126880 [Parastagonospora nodorum]KAH3989378.1 hypothetical protein HBH52_015030 [Parastagonospora nodorum]KAH3997092.1 hypothetical protein HBI10_148600 [Parastagonospora nodorum]KAH4017217.1 hypothetical protein HBI09_198380 [Parastagonospora nodorum]KAH4020064.1 hypothetical protein HBI13_121730 [Parastagonospora nodorum]
MPPLSSDTSTSHLSTRKAHPTTPKPLRLEVRKESLVTKSLPTLSKKSQAASKTAPSKKSTSSSHNRELKGKSISTDPDSGPKRGNRAAMSPCCVPAPDVNAFIQYIATHDRRRSNSHGTPTIDAARKPALSPQHAGHEHGDMIPTAFNKAEDGIGQKEKGKITQAVWRELGRQQRMERARGEAGLQMNKVEGGNGGGLTVLLRALTKRVGGYRHGGGGLKEV